MLNRTTLLALGTALAVALVPITASAKAGGGGGGNKGGGNHGKHAHHHHHRHHHHRIVVWHRKVVPIVVGSTAVAAYAATTNTCTCLTKEYLPDGTVLFKDVCTKEMAMNPPAGKQAEVR
jgi:hypothetical protein